MAKSTKIKLNGAVLRWARDSAGLRLEKAASALKLETPEFESIEVSGTITPSQLEKLSSLYKRPLAAFFMPKPAIEAPMPKDFRMGKHGSSALSPEARFGIRKARRLQKISLQILTEMKLPIEPLFGKARVHENSEIVAKRIRFDHKIPLTLQTSWTTYNQAFSTWRESIEKLNVFVFQMAIPSKEIRGFSLPSLPNVITVSSSDAIVGRIFTLFHEYAHLLLREPGICLPSETNPEQDGDIEHWCDSFAASFLLPQEIFANNKDVSAFIGSSKESTFYLSQLARRYKVSREVMLRRLLTLDIISTKRFTRELDLIYSEPIRSGSKGGFVPPSRKSLSERGKSFTRLVLNASEREIVSLREVSSFLGVRLKHLNEIEKLVA